MFKPMQILISKILNLVFFCLLIVNKIYLEYKNIYFCYVLKIKIEVYKFFVFASAKTYTTLKSTYKTISSSQKRNKTKIYYITVRKQQKFTLKIIKPLLKKSLYYINVKKKNIRKF